MLWRDATENIQSNKENWVELIVSWPVVCLSERDREKPARCTRNNGYGRHEKKSSRCQPLHDFSADRKINPAQERAEHKSHEKINAGP